MGERTGSDGGVERRPWDAAPLHRLTNPYILVRFHADCTTNFVQCYEINTKTRNLWWIILAFGRVWGWRFCYSLARPRMSNPAMIEPRRRPPPDDSTVTDASPYMLSL